MYRNNSYEANLAKELQNPKAAQVFLLALMEGDDGLSVEEALKHTIRRMGVKEFSVRARVAMPNVMNFLRGQRKLKPESLDVFLKPFRLRTRLVLERAS
jgi:hypothetical protein